MSGRCIPVSSAGCSQESLRITRLRLRIKLLGWKSNSFRVETVQHVVVIPRSVRYHKNWKVMLAFRGLPRHCGGTTPAPTSLFRSPAPKDYAVTASDCTTLLQARYTRQFAGCRSVSFSTTTRSWVASSMASPVCQAACELTKAAASGGRHAKLPGPTRAKTQALSSPRSACP